MRRSYSGRRGRKFSHRRSRRRRSRYVVVSRGGIRLP